MAVYKEKHTTATKTLTQRQLELGKLNALKQKLAGTVVLPHDTDYDEARKSWNLSYQHQPLIIVMALNASDIAAAVVFAQQADLNISVQATGHGVRRPAVNCMLINTSRMNKVRDRKSVV